MELVTKVGRYLVVSAINLVVHFSLLTLALKAWDWPGEWANTFAAVVAMVPAFLLSRYWVWDVKGKADLRAEVIPFIVLSVAGGVLSSVLAGVADRLSDRDLVVSAASLLGYLVVWVIKFLFLNAVFDRSRARQQSMAEVSG